MLHCCIKAVCTLWLLLSSSLGPCFAAEAASPRIAAEPAGPRDASQNTPWDLLLEVEAADFAEEILEGEWGGGFDCLPSTRLDPAPRLVQSCLLSNPARRLAPSQSCNLPRPPPTC